MKKKFIWNKITIYAFSYESSLHKLSLLPYHAGLLIHVFPQAVEQPNLTSMGSNKNECLAFKCDNHQSKNIPETMIQTQLANIQQRP